MIDPFELYEELCGSVNTQQGGHVRPNRNFLQWINAISKSLFEEKFAAWEKSQKIVDDLSRPFLRSVNVQVKPVGSMHGVAPFPPDYGHYSSARYFTFNGKNTGLPDLATVVDCCEGKFELRVPGQCPPNMDAALWEAIVSEQKAMEALSVPAGARTKMTEVTIDLISNSRWGSALSHKFSHPTMEEPRMTQYDGGYKVAPSGITIIVLDYLRIPAEATFEYTVAPGDPLTGSGDYLIYDRLKSKPLDWSSLVRGEFLDRLDKKYGKYIREEFIWQTAESDRKSTV